VSTRSWRPEMKIQSDQPHPNPSSNPVRAKVQEFVSQTFIGTLLKQVRESPFKSELFSGGSGGEAYRSLYDQHVTSQVAPGIGGKLIDALERQFKSEKTSARRLQSNFVETELKKRAYDQSAKPSETNHVTLNRTA